jgi:predicted HTH transcriptional regulator
MTRKPYEIYTTSDWKFLAQPKIEGQWFERKSHSPNHTPSNLKEFRFQLSRGICGFANSNPDVGGLLVIGIGNNGELHGLDGFGSEYINNVLEYHQVLDGPIPEHKIVEFVREDGSTDHLVFIFTPFLQGRVARTTNGECHVRRGDDTITLNRWEKVQELAYQKGELIFEDEPAVPLNSQELDSGIVAEFIQQYIRQRRLRDEPTIADVLRLGRLSTQKDSITWLTKGGLLVFHKDPREMIPGAYVRYFRYEGRDEQTTLLRDEVFEGPIPTVIQKLRDFLPTQFSRFSYRQDGVLTSQEEYPPSAWDEAVVNALVHRSYSHQTRPIWIKHFDNRFEIVSPGSYPLGVDPATPIHTPRNTHLMEALRYLDFVRMAEEGIKTMRRVMQDANLSAPEYSPPELDRVVCTLYNNIDKRVQARSDLSVRATIEPTSVVSNLYPLIIRTPIAEDTNAPFAEEAGRPIFGEIRNAFLESLRKSGFRVDSFASVSAVDFTSEYVIPALARSKLASIYPGLEFRLVELHRSFYLVVDHIVEVRSRADAGKVGRALPWLKLDNHRRCFVRQGSIWKPGHIVGIHGDRYSVELRIEDQIQPESVEVQPENIIPNLKTTELNALLQSEGVQIQLIQELRKAAFMGKDAPRRRHERIREIVQMLMHRVFPLVVNQHEVRLSDSPAQINQPPLTMGRQLRDPKAQFDSKGFRQDEDVLRGLTSFGSFEKPQREIPLVIMCPATWAGKMQNLIGRIRQGAQRYRGIESTFGIRLGTITTVISELQEYETRVVETIAQLPRDSRPVFVVFAPERGVSRANYDAPYYRLKRLLLEMGYPSQMVKEETLENPEWKDFNFALDIFAKAGFVPWVLSEGMPNADLFVGLSSSVISHRGSRQRIIGYANVFDDFGRWLFYQGATESVPFENRNGMFAGLLGSIASEYQSKRRKLQWVHVHHSAKLRHEDRQEIARGILEQAPDVEISFVHINEHNAYRLFDESPKSDDGTARRGSWVMLSPNNFTLATIGANSVGQKYLGTPRPLDVKVNRVNSQGKLDLAIYAQHTLSLTRLNWASTRSFCHSPITIKFANDIAYLMNVFLATGKQFQLHNSLRNTPWFL